MFAFLSKGKHLVSTSWFLLLTLYWGRNQLEAFSSYGATAKSVVKLKESKYEIIVRYMLLSFFF